MDGVALLSEARTAGLRVRVEGNFLRLDGPRRLESLARALLARKLEVMEVLAVEDAEVAWRASEMRSQVPAHGPIPFLVAGETPSRTDGCASCGGVVGAGRVRCYLCIAAAERVLNAIREGVPPRVPLRSARPRGVSEQDVDVTPGPSAAASIRVSDGDPVKRFP